MTRVLVESLKTISFLLKTVYLLLEGLEVVNKIETLLLPENATQQHKDEYHESLKELEHLCKEAAGDQIKEALRSLSEALDRLIEIIEKPQAIQREMFLEATRSALESETPLNDFLQNHLQSTTFGFRDASIELRAKLHEIYGRLGQVAGIAKDVLSKEDLENLRDRIEQARLLLQTRERDCCLTRSTERTALDREQAVFQHKNSRQDTVEQEHDHDDHGFGMRM